MVATTRRQFGRFGLIAAAAALLVSIIVLAPATDAADDLVIMEDAGVILVSTGPDSGSNWIRYYADPSTPFDVSAWDEHQDIVVDRCGVSTTPSLLHIEPSPNVKGLGLVSNGLGVRTKNNCATGNGQVDVTQSLTFSLGSFFGATYAIDRVEVDVEGKQNAQLSYTLNNDAGSGTKTINPASDNGADAGVGDNAIVVIDGDKTTENTRKPFTSITFSPTGNSKALISIEGGGDGNLPGEDGSIRSDLDVNQTVFRVVTTRTFDGEFLCGESRGPTSADEDGPALDGLVERGDNLKVDDCERIPYTFQIQDDSVYFDYLDDGEQGARFLVRIDWDPADPIVDPLDPPDRLINYAPDVDPGAYVVGLACSSLVFDSDPSDPTPKIDDEYEHPVVGGEVVPWCIAGEQLTLTSSGEWQQIQWWDGIGDPRWR
jgi:hypothetical protein